MLRRLAIAGGILGFCSAHAAQFSISNLDGADEGFNDSTVISDANQGALAGETLGEARMRVVLAAADYWAQRLSSTVAIKVDANFDELTCSSGGATLGSAGAAFVYEGPFDGGGEADTFYPGALADALDGTDLSGSTDIRMRLNSSIDNGCLAASVKWYYGEDYAAPGNFFSLFGVVLHELAHGLGFADFVRTDGDYLVSGVPGVYDRRLYDETLDQPITDLTQAQRAASLINSDDEFSTNSNLTWMGEHANNQSGQLTVGPHPNSPGRIRMFAPDPYIAGSSVAHWDESLQPNALMEPSADDGELLDLATCLMRDIGWIMLNDFCPTVVPEISSPADGSTLAGSSQTFTWSPNGVTPTEWRVLVGSAAGQNDIFRKKGLSPATTSFNVTGLPTDGQTLHVTLLYEDAGWNSVAATYTAANLAGATPELTSPADGSTLAGSSQTFSWSPNGVTPTEWRVLVGSAAGQNDIFRKKGLSPATTSFNVTGLPTDGQTLHVTLLYEDAGWNSVAATYTAANLAGATPELTSPADGSTLAGSSQTFTWSPNGVTPTEWRVLVGSAAGQNDIFRKKGLSPETTSFNVTGLPTDGQTLHVTLLYEDAGWNSVAATYTAANLAGATPELTSPADGSTLAGSSQTFTWSPNGVTPTEWRVLVGSAAGQNDIFRKKGLSPETTSFNVTGLPTDGQTLHVTLLYEDAGWNSVAATYTASGAPP